MAISARKFYHLKVLSRDIHKLSYSDVKCKLSDTLSEEQKNYLLEDQLVNFDNFDAARYLLEIGANPNLKTLNILGKRFQFAPHRPLIPFSGQERSNLALPLQIFYSCDDYPLINRKWQLLSEFNTNFNINNKREIPLIDCVLSVVPQNEDHMKQLASLVATLLMNKVDLSESAFKADSKLLKYVLQEISLRNSSSEFDTAIKDYNNYRSKITRLVNA